MLTIEIGQKARVIDNENGSSHYFKIGEVVEFVGYGNNNNEEDSSYFEYHFKGITLSGTLTKQSLIESEFELI